MLDFVHHQEALSDTFRFVAYAVVCATHEDMKLVRAFLTDDDLREALDHAPPGIIDPRSWAYWNAKLGRYPAPPSQSVNWGNAASSMTCIIQKHLHSRDLT
jgi:hypothetical protein